MTPERFLLECFRGGPGLDGYAYNADVYCCGCARKIGEQIAPSIAPRILDTSDPLFRDSETCPQPIFFGESDNAQVCGECGEYLYGDPEGSDSLVGDGEKDD